MDRASRWILIAIEHAISLGVLDFDDIGRHLSPQVLAASLPPEQLSALMSAGLAQQSFDAQFLVEQIGVAQLAAHVPSAALWACIAEAARTIIEEQGLAPEFQADTRLNAVP